MNKASSFAHILSAMTLLLCLCLSAKSYSSVPEYNWGNANGESLIYVKKDSLTETLLYKAEDTQITVINISAKVEKGSKERYKKKTVENKIPTSNIIKEEKVEVPVVENEKTIITKSPVSAQYLNGDHRKFSGLTQTLSFTKVKIKPSTEIYILNLDTLSKTSIKYNTVANDSLTEFIKDSSSIRPPPVA